MTAAPSLSLSSSSSSPSPSSPSSPSSSSSSSSSSSLQTWLREERCVVCGGARARGVLCAGCCAGLVVDDVCAEQIASRGRVPAHGHENAWLIDGFGVPHTVTVPPSTPSTSTPSMPSTTPSTANLRTATLGRSPQSDVAVFERTVSQAHAVLEHRPLSNAWFVVDVGSDNGVYVGADRVPRRFPLERGDRVFLGKRVGFIFVPLDAVDVDAARDAVAVVDDWGGDTVGDGGDLGVRVRIVAATEGGAVALLGRERVLLSELEYELLVSLHQRYAADVDKDAAARGFVPAAQLLSSLSFVSEAPTHANLRGLVKKLRKKFADRDPPTDIVESQQGLGYRLARPVELA